MTARGRNRFMRRISGVITMYRLTFVVAALLVAAVTSAEDPPSPQQLRDFATAIKEIARGQETFRHDTFGNEAFWGGALRLHDAIAGGANGGSGTGLAPATALALGLKVDVDALPNNLRNALRKSRVDLGDPGTTLALLKLGAVVIL
jgi:hypothetical protein